ncbi:MAG: HupE/UreJ family protein [Alphaproteobacteria bacterium]
MFQLLQTLTSPKVWLAVTGLAVTLIAIFGIIPDALAHGVTQGDKGYIQEITGTHPIPFLYLGAKHMMTGYDHLLFLFGVIFFLYRLKDVSIYVTLFAVGHVITLLSGVLMEISISAYIIDAIIGFSVVYKALDNMGAFQRWFKYQPNTKVATFVFGLFHGFGLATKILDYELSPDGLLANLIAFNIGVEIGQILALSAILIAITYWRKSGSFMKHAYSANTFMMMLGFLLMGYQITGYILS